MATLIHHATAKRAKAFGITLSANAEGATAICGKFSTQAPTATEALQRMEKVLKHETQQKQTGTATSVKPEKKSPKPKAVKRPKVRDEDEEGDGENDEPEEGKGSVVKAKYRALYKPHDDTNGDDFSTALREAITTVDEDEVTTVDLDELYTIAEAHGITKSFRGKNPGMQRMNIGNMLRARQRQGMDVKIGGKLFKGAKIEAKEKPAVKKRTKKAA